MKQRKRRSRGGWSAFFFFFCLGFVPWVLFVNDRLVIHGVTWLAAIQKTNVWVGMLCFFIIYAWFLLMVYVVLMQVSLMVRGVHVPGVVVGTREESKVQSNGTLERQIFRVVKFRSKQQTEYELETARALKVGKTVHVIYDPADPNNNAQVGGKVCAFLLMLALMLFCLFLIVAMLSIFMIASVNL